MERLTPKGLGKTIQIPINKTTLFVAYAMRLAELEDKLESGQLMELPCIREIKHNFNGIEVINYELLRLNESGQLIKDIFCKADKAQAEARLKELQEK